jgi:hypothetical protein
MLNLARTHDVLAGEIAVAVFKPSGLSPAQYNVLRILRGAGRAPGVQRNRKPYDRPRSGHDATCSTGWRSAVSCRVAGRKPIAALWRAHHRRRPETLAELDPKSSPRIASSLLTWTSAN